MEREKELAQKMSRRDCVTKAALTGAFTLGGFAMLHKKIAGRSQS